MKKLLLASLLASAAVSAQTLPNTNTDAHTYEFVQSYDLVPPQGSKGETNLWVPLPFSNDYQTVQAVEFEGDFTNGRLSGNVSYHPSETEKHNLLFTTQLNENILSLPQYFESDYTTKSNLQIQHLSLIHISEPTRPY